MGIVPLNNLIGKFSANFGKLAPNGFNSIIFLEEHCEIVLSNHPQIIIILFCFDEFREFETKFCDTFKNVQCGHFYLNLALFDQ